MVSEETLIERVIDKETMKKIFYNEEFNRMLTEIQTFEGAQIYIKKVVIEEVDGGDMEEGEVEGKRGKAVYEKVDKADKLRKVIEGTTVFEYPTLYVVIKK